MKTNYPKFSKKTFIRLQNPEFRKQILTKYLPKFKDTGLEEYAMHLLTVQEASRNKEHCENKTYFYGYQPINALGAVLKDGSIKVQMFEFSLINTHLRTKRTRDALEIMKCVLCLYALTNSNIQNFNIEKIENYISNLEKRVLETSNTNTEQKENT